MIIDLLWRDEPPASAAGIVQTYVSRLRSALGPRIARDAVDCLLRALPLFQTHQADRYYALCLFKLGHAYEAMGARRLAVPYLEDSVRAFRQLLLPGRVEEALGLLERCRLGD